MWNRLFHFKYSAGRNGFQDYFHLHPKTLWISDQSKFLKNCRSRMFIFKILWFSWNVKTSLFSFFSPFLKKNWKDPIKSVSSNMKNNILLTGKPFFFCWLDNRADPIHGRKNKTRIFQEDSFHWGRKSQGHWQNEQTELKREV